MSIPSAVIFVFFPNDRTGMLPFWPSYQFNYLSPHHISVAQQTSDKPVIMKYQIDCTQVSPIPHEWNALRRRTQHQGSRHKKNIGVTTYFLCKPLLSYPTKTKPSSLYPFRKFLYLLWIVFMEWISIAMNNEMAPMPGQICEIFALLKIFTALWYIRLSMNT